MTFEDFQIILSYVKKGLGRRLIEKAFQGKYTPSTISRYITLGRYHSLEEIKNVIANNAKLPHVPLDQARAIVELVIHRQSQVDAFKKYKEFSLIHASLLFLANYSQLTKVYKDRISGKLDKVEPAQEPTPWIKASRGGHPRIHIENNEKSFSSSLTDSGKPTVVRKSKKVTKEQSLKIIELIKEGKSNSAIAKAMNNAISQSTCGRYKHYYRLHGEEALLDYLTGKKVLESVSEDRLREILVYGVKNNLSVGQLSLLFHVSRSQLSKASKQIKCLDFDCDVQPPVLSGPSSVKPERRDYSSNRVGRVGILRKKLSDKQRKLFIDLCLQGYTGEGISNMLNGFLGVWMCELYVGIFRYHGAEALKEILTHGFKNVNHDEMLAIASHAISSYKTARTAAIHFKVSPSALDNYIRYIKDGKYQAVAPASPPKKQEFVVELPKITVRSYSSVPNINRIMPSNKHSPSVCSALSSLLSFLKGHEESEHHNALNLETLTKQQSSSRNNKGDIIFMASPKRELVVEEPTTKKKSKKSKTVSKLVTQSDNHGCKDALAQENSSPIGQAVELPEEQRSALELILKSANIKPDTSDKQAIEDDKLVRNAFDNHIPITMAQTGKDGEYEIAVQGKVLSPNCTLVRSVKYIYENEFLPAQALAPIERRDGQFYGKAKQEVLHYRSARTKMSAAAKRTYDAKHEQEIEQRRAERQRKKEEKLQELLDYQQDLIDRVTAKGRLTPAIEYFKRDRSKAGKKTYYDPYSVGFRELPADVQLASLHKFLDMEEYAERFRKKYLALIQQ